MFHLTVMLLIFSVALGTHVSLTPPQPPPAKDKLKSGDFTSLSSFSIVIYKFSCWIHAATEISIILLSVLRKQYPNANFIFIDNDHLLFNTLLIGTGANISFSRVRILGGLMALSGDLIRYLCFRELGRHFTFHVAILDNHRLVTTGPYAIVRHPSYTGAFLMLIGNILWHVTPGSWLWESRIYASKISWLLLAPSALMTYLFFEVAITRPNKEDELLKKEFGKEWDQWAQAVPYQVIRGVY